MKAFGPAYQWEESDGPVTVENVYRLRGEYAREWISARGLDSEVRPVLILTYEQRADLALDPAIRGHLTWDSSFMRLRQVCGFRIVVTEEE